VILIKDGYGCASARFKPRPSYGITLLPEVAADVEARDERGKLIRYAPPMPSRSVGLA
jgi:hypothetical protein